MSLPSAFPASLWAGDACRPPSRDTDRRVLSEARLWVSPPPTVSAGRTLTGAFGEVSSPEMGSECPHPQRRPAQGGALVTSHPPAPGRKGQQSAQTYRGHHRPRLTAAPTSPSLAPAGPTSCGPHGGFGSGRLSPHFPLGLGAARRVSPLDETRSHHFQREGLCFCSYPAGFQVLLTSVLRGPEAGRAGRLDGRRSRTLRRAGRLDGPLHGASFPGAASGQGGAPLCEQGTAPSPPSELCPAVPPLDPPACAREPSPGPGRWRAEVPWAALALTEPLEAKFKCPTGAGRLERWACPASGCQDCGGHRHSVISHHPR